MWDTTATSNNNASVTSAVTGATEEDDDNDVVAVSEEDQEMPTTDVNVVNNTAGVDDLRMDTQDVYKVWNEEVPEYDVGEVD